MNSAAKPNSRCSSAAKVEDLRLDGHVERGGGFVRDDQRGSQGERPGQGGALPLAAAEFVRIAVAVTARQVDRLQQRVGLGADRGGPSSRRWTVRGSAMLSATVSSGLKLAAGSWNT